MKQVLRTSAVTTFRVTRASTRAAFAATQAAASFAYQGQEFINTSTNTEADNQSEYAATRSSQALARQIVEKTQAAAQAGVQTVIHGESIASKALGDKIYDSAKAHISANQALAEKAQATTQAATQAAKAQVEAARLSASKQAARTQVTHQRSAKAYKKARIAKKHREALKKRKIHTAKRRIKQRETIAAFQDVQQFKDPRVKVTVKKANSGRLRDRLGDWFKSFFRRKRHLGSRIGEAIARFFLHYLLLGIGLISTVGLLLGALVFFGGITAGNMRPGGSGMTDAQREAVVQAALGKLGLPYIYGGNDPDVGLDCSGLTQYAYKQIGVDLPRTAQGQYDLVDSLGNMVTDPSQLRRGDLVFYGRWVTTTVTDENGVEHEVKKAIITHVTIYLGHDEMIHEPHPGDVCKISPFRTQGFIGGGSPVEGGGDMGSLSGGGTVQIPRPDGSNIYTITEYDRINWARGTAQRAVFNQWNDSGHWTNGFATINGYYLIACTPKFGRVGDIVEFRLSDGRVLPCIIADEKNTSDPGCNEWGHDNGRSIIEFEVQSSWYRSYGNPGSRNWMPEWRGLYVDEAMNTGRNILG